MNKQFIKDIQIANKQRKSCLTSLVIGEVCTMVQ